MTGTASVFVRSAVAAAAANAGGAHRQIEVSDVSGEGDQAVEERFARARGARAGGGSKVPPLR